MRFNEVFNALQNLIKTEINQAELGRVIGVSRANINYKKQANSLISDEDVKKIETHYNVSILPKTLAERLMEGASFAAKVSLPDDAIKIPYWEGLPEDLKHPEYTHVLAQKISIEQGWGLEAESLRIVPMVGDKMTNYWYRINDGDILIIDTSHKQIRGNGVYFATSRNNTRFWIREMQVLVNNDVEFKGFAPSGNTIRTVPKEQLDEAGFKIIGKVVKNVSFRL